MTEELKSRDFEDEEQQQEEEAPVCGQVKKTGRQSVVVCEFSDDVIQKDQSEIPDCNQMETFIDKILEKYGESDVIGERQSTSRDVMSEGNDVTEVPGIDRNRRVDVCWKSASGDMDTRRREREREDRSEEERRRRQDGGGGGGRGLKRRQEEEIGGVIRSQNGVTRQLIEVSEGLDELNGDLERMKRELERVRMNAYVDKQQDRKQEKQRHADGHNSGLDELTFGIHQRNRGWTDEKKERVQSNWRGREADEKPRDWGYEADVTDRRRRYGNEWIEEREGVFRLGQIRDVLHLEPPVPPVPSVPPVPGRGREHIKGDAVQMTHLLTIAEPRWEEGGEGPWTSVYIDRFGRTTDEGAFTLADDSISSSSGVHKRRQKDGYCYMCEEFEDSGKSGWNQSNGSSAKGLSSSSTDAFHRSCVDDFSKTHGTKGSRLDLLRPDSDEIQTMDSNCLLRSSARRHHHHHHQPLTSSSSPRIQIQKKPETAEFHSRFLTKIRLKKYEAKTLSQSLR